MPLLEIWKSAPDAVAKMSIEQIVSSAGDGVLKDGSPCSVELRAYLSQVSSLVVGAYIDQCLASSFIKSGMVLQDLVNELGRRLGYIVENGRYQGIRNANGYDGLWASPEGHHIVVEVKTTDSYRISLDTIVVYRTKLLDSAAVTGLPSILIVVGRDDTGDLEAQVRGSRHVWDIRLISADALIKLAQLKENTEAAETELKIRSLLIPKEFTRLDNIIDVIFTTVVDVENTTVNFEILPDQENQAEKPEGTWEFTSKTLIDRKRDQIIAALNRKFEEVLIKKKGVYYWDAHHRFMVVCTLSKKYEGKPHDYWFGYHHEWRDFLLGGQQGYIVLGCMDLADAFAVPAQEIEPILGSLNTTMQSDKIDYWHFRMVKLASGGYGLAISAAKPFSLEPYRLAL